MVNTFITRVGDFPGTARDLDRQRLNKQCTEAMQIVNILDGYEAAAKYLSLPPFPEEVDTTVEERTGYFDLVWQTMEQYGISSLEFTNKGEFTVIPKGKDKGNGKEKERELEGGQLFTSGFSRHTAVRSWLGFTKALMYYTNCCLEEWIARGYNNNRPFYSVPSEVILPSWTRNEEVIRRIRRVLVEKELSSPYRVSRPEELHYCLKEEFVHDFVCNGYNYHLFQSYLLQGYRYNCSNNLPFSKGWAYSCITSPRVEELPNALLRLKGCRKEEDGYLWL